MDEPSPDAMTDAQWREFVMTRLRRGDARFDSLENATTEMRSALAANTQLVAEVKHDFGALRTQINPLVDAMTTMEAGIRTIGRIGAFGAAFGKAALVIFVAWVTLRFLVGGASWADVRAALQAALGK